MMVGGDAFFDEREDLIVDGVAAAHWRVQPALDAGLHQFLRVCEFDVVDADRNLELVRLVDDDTIERRR